MTATLPSAMSKLTVHLSAVTSSYGGGSTGRTGSTRKTSLTVRNTRYLIPVSFTTNYKHNFDTGCSFSTVRRLYVRRSLHRILDCIRKRDNSLPINSDRYKYCLTKMNILHFQIFFLYLLKISGYRWETVQTQWQCCCKTRRHSLEIIRIQ